MPLLALLLVSNLAWGHSLAPMRFEVNSGENVVIALLTLTNNFDRQDRFAIDCYKGTTGAERIQCQSIPEAIVLAPKRSRKVKVSMPVSGDGLYRICSTEDPAEDEERTIVTRICATVGVGVNPNERTSQRPQHRAAANAVATRQRPDSLR